MRLVTETKRGHGPWARKEQISKVIDLQKLFNEYWTSNAHEITVSGQSRSPTDLPVSNREAQRLLLWKRILAHLNYCSMPNLLFVSLQPLIPVS